MENLALEVPELGANFNSPVEPTPEAHTCESSGMRNASMRAYFCFFFSLTAPP